MAAVEHVTSLLSSLKTLIKRLPPDSPTLNAPKGGPVHQNFTNFDVPEGENLYFAVDRAWTRTFQNKSGVKIGGKYGVGIVYTFFAHFAKQDMGSDSSLLGLRIEQFTKLVEDIVGDTADPPLATGSTSIPLASDEHILRKGPSSAPIATPSQSSDERSTTSTGPTNGNAGSAAANNELVISSDNSQDGSEESECDWEDSGSDEVVEEVRPKKAPLVTQEPQSRKGKKPPARNGGKAWTSPKKSTKRNVPLSAEAKLIKEKKAKIQKKAAEKQRSKAKPKDTRSGSSGDEMASDGSDVEEMRRSTAAISAWAFSHFTPIPKNNRNESIWKWECKWCSGYRTSPRTSGTKDYSDEKLPLPSVSNFSSHLKSSKCKIPREHAFGSTSSTPSADARGLPEAVSVENSLTRQRKIIHDFTERGKEEPAPTFTQQGFRTNLVKAIIEDGLPFSFTQGRGIKRLFAYTIPKTPLPSRHSIRRDLDLLYDALSNKLKKEIEAIDGKISASSDIWTNRSSVFAFLGVKIFWISRDWRLVSHVLDLIHLDGDHSGATTGKAMFNSLVTYKLIKKLLANVTDNAKSNHVHNRAMSKRRRKALKDSTLPDVGEAGCAGHVVHLTAQELLATFGIIAPTSEVDHFLEDNRRHGLVYSAETDPDITAEEAEEEAQLKGPNKKRIALQEAEPDDSDSDLDGDDSESNLILKKHLNVAEKVHEVIIHINRSPIQRGVFRKLVIKHCPSECHRLALVKGMDVRWNSKFAELKRARQLSSAIDEYIKQMEAGKTGKKLTEAKKRRLQWYISPWEWESIDQLCGILETFHYATIELSREDVPTLPMVLPLYKAIEAKLEEGKDAASQGNAALAICEDAFDAALNKLAIYTSIVCESDLHLLATVLHPCYRIAWFESRERWESTSLATKVRTLVTKTYCTYAEIYGDEGKKKQPPNASQRPQSGLLAQTIHSGPSNTSHLEELDSYFRNSFPCNNYNDGLQWWKTYESTFPILARMARDLFAVPGVSISVERLFSVCRHVITEARSSMTANTARRTVCVKEWLTEGLGHDILSL